MSSFFDGRTQVTADTLVGPRVYSTDLVPQLLSTSDPQASVAITASALKIKIITKGIVTLNSAYLVSPLAILLIAQYPDLVTGNSLLPAFRTDKSQLSDLTGVFEAQYRVHGIDQHQLDDHIQLLEASIRRVMPWDLGDVPEQYRQCVVANLSSDASLVSRELASVGFGSPERQEFIAVVTGMDLRASEPLRDYIAALPSPARGILSRYTTSCYHIVGTGVVKCETGTDLNPLSQFKAADVLLASRDASGPQLSDESIFLKSFMAYALGAVQTIVLPEQVIEKITFDEANRLSDALRQSGFQQKYQRILDTCAATINEENSAEALDKLDPDAVFQVARDIADEFETHIEAELKFFKTKGQLDSEQEAYHAVTDVALDAAGAVPGVGSVVSAVQMIGHGFGAAEASLNALRSRDRKQAAVDARNRRDGEIKAAIDGLRTDQPKKDKLLRLAAALTDIYVARITRD